MNKKTFIKTCEVLTEKVENLEFAVKCKDRRIADLEEENKKLKEQKQSVSEFIDRTQAKIEKRTIKGG